jgi:Zn-dependent protease
VSYPDYDNSPGVQLLRLLLRSFRIGVFFGVEVRMYWAALALPLLFSGWVASGDLPTTAMLAAIQFVALFAVIWTHEMGHIAMGWRHRIRTDLITLGPLGGVAHLNAPAPSAGAELQIALAGPAVHLGWLAVVWPLSFATPAGGDWFVHPLWHAVWYLKVTNVGLLLFNLLPVFPLDGGRALRALLAMRWHPNRVTLWVTSGGFVGGGLLMLYALAGGRIESTICFLIGASCISACLFERRLARHVPIYGRFELQQPWQVDPEAWKRAAPGVLRQPARPGWFTRWRQQRLAATAAKRAAEQAALDQEVDAILARVHEVGMTGLSDREKAVLKRASERRRGTG